MTVQYANLTLDWFGYATVRLQVGETVVYVDPGRYGVLTGDWTGDSKESAVAHPPGDDRSPRDGDLVCVSHLHHYDPDGIARVARDDAAVLVPEGLNVRESARDLPRPVDLDHTVRTVGQESEGVVADVPYWTVPAYNDPDGPHVRPDGTPYHPEGLGCGYLLALDGHRVFCPGDTDVLEGHAELDVDVFLPPIGGTYTMDREEAAALAVRMAPDLVVPVHYNTFAAIETDSRAFAADVASEGIPVSLDES